MATALSAFSIGPLRGRDGALRRRRTKHRLTDGAAHRPYPTLLRGERLHFFIVLALAISLRASMSAAEPLAFRGNAPLAAALERSVTQTVEAMRGPSLRADEIAATVIDLGQPGPSYPHASHR